MSLFGVGRKKAGQGAKAFLRGLRTGADTGTPLDLSSDEILDEALLPLFRDVEIPAPQTGQSYRGRGRQESLLDDGAFDDKALENLLDGADTEDLRMRMDEYEFDDLREEAGPIPDAILEGQMRKFKRTGGLEVPEPRTEGPFLPQDAPPKVNSMKPDDFFDRKYGEGNWSYGDEQGPAESFFEDYLDDELKRGMPRGDVLWVKKPDGVWTSPLYANDTMWKRGEINNRAKYKRLPVGNENPVYSGDLNKVDEMQMAQDIAERETFLKDQQRAKTREVTQDNPPKVTTEGKRVKLSDKEIDALTDDDIVTLIPNNRMGDYEPGMDPAEWFRNERDEAIELYKDLREYAKKRNMDLQDVTGAIEQLGGSPTSQDRMQYLLDTFDMDGSLKQLNPEYNIDNMPF